MAVLYVIGMRIRNIEILNGNQYSVIDIKNFLFIDNLEQRLTEIQT